MRAYFCKFCFLVISSQPKDKIYITALENLYHLHLTLQHLKPINILLTALSSTLEYLKVNNVFCFLDAVIASTLVLKLVF